MEAIVGRREGSLFISCDCCHIFFRPLSSFFFRAHTCHPPFCETLARCPRGVHYYKERAFSPSSSLLSLSHPISSKTKRRCPHNEKSTLPKDRCNACFFWQTEVSTSYTPHYGKKQVREGKLIVFSRKEITRKAKKIYSKTTRRFEGKRPMH